MTTAIGVSRAAPASAVSAQQRTAHARRATTLLAVPLLAVAAGCSNLPTALDEDAGAVPEQIGRPSFALASFPAGTAFYDGFDSFDAGFWERSAHWLGRGPLKPENVVVEGGYLRLNARAAGYEGAEVLTRSLYGNATFTVRGRCAVPEGAVCAFFMYQIGVGDRADEIDIEILPERREVWFTTWVRGRRRSHAVHRLDFDPAAGFHTYSIQRAADRITFSVDGTVLTTVRSKNSLPRADMPLFANAWWPTWLTDHGGTGAWEIDWIRVE